MVWVLMSTVFFAAGAAKVIRGGPAWVFSENFSYLLLQRHYNDQTPALSWGLFFAKHPLLYRGFAAGTIGIELGLFLAPFSRKARTVLPWMLLSMQLGIGLFMRVWFTCYMFVYLFWIPWDEVFHFLARRLGMAPAATTRAAAPASAPASSGANDDPENDGDDGLANRPWGWPHTLPAGLRRCGTRTGAPK